MYNMPDTTSQRGFWHRRSNTLLVLAAFSVTFMLFAPHLVSAQGGGDQDDQDDSQSCPGATVVETFEGNTSQDTRPFDIGSENWQVVVETEPTNEQAFPFTTVDIVENESFSTIQTQDFNNGDDGIIDLQGAGTYYLGIFTDLQSYNVTVQQCGGGAVAPDASDVSQDQYEGDDDALQQTPPTGGPPLSVVAVMLLWLGVGGILVARRFA